MNLLAVDLVQPDGATPRRLDPIIKDIVAAAIVRCGGNMSRAARELGIGRSTIYRMVGTDESRGGDDGETPKDRGDAHA